MKCIAVRSAGWSSASTVRGAAPAPGKNARRPGPSHGRFPLTTAWRWWTRGGPEPSPVSLRRRPRVRAVPPAAVRAATAPSQSLRRCFVGTILSAASSRDTRDLTPRLGPGPEPQKDRRRFSGDRGLWHGLTLGSLTRARTALQTGVSRVTLALVHAAGPTLVVSMRAARVHPQCGVKNGSPGANGHLRVAHGRGLTPPLGDFPEIGIFHTAIT